MPGNFTYLTGKTGRGSCEFYVFNRQNRKGSAFDLSELQALQAGQCLNSKYLTCSTGREVPVNSTYLTGKTGRGSACDLSVICRHSRQGSACGFSLFVGITCRAVPVNSTYSGSTSRVSAFDFEVIYRLYRQGSACEFSVFNRKNRQG